LRVWPSVRQLLCGGVLQTRSAGAKRVAVAALLWGILCAAGVGVLWGAVPGAAAAAPDSAGSKSPAPLVMGVMDPLAAPLACPCVKGFAQRDYGRLGEFLESRLKRPVRVVYAESVDAARRLAPQGRLDVIIGKDSVVRFDAVGCGLKVEPLARLTDKQGRTTLRGLFVVVRDDPARSIKDLAGYRIFFGPREEAEKHPAALVALEASGVDPPEQIETRPSCTNAALDLLENKEPRRAAAVISDYARVLLEGCGTIKPGELRVVGQTPEVPFVTLFVVGELDATTRERLAEALQAVRRNPALLRALESRSGFVLLGRQGAGQKRAADSTDPSLPSERTAPKQAAGSDGGQQMTAGMALFAAPAPHGSAGAESRSLGIPAQRRAQAAEIWPGWRGPRRDGHCSRLPERLPDRLPVLWQKPTTGAGLSGVAATERYVIFSDRDSLDRYDIFRCLRVEDGREVWKLEYPAAGRLDYGNSPRATPLVADGRVYLLGAFGHLHCVRLSDGHVVWKKHLAADYGAEPPTWGYCASPLLVDGKLVVNPGAREASLVALDAQTGKELWRSPGLPAAYASLIVGRFGGVRQIVGYDAVSLGGWDIETGRRLWALLPPEQGDFNVPTPIDFDGRLLVSTENNGTRLYQFDSQGRIVKQPAAECFELAPDSHTPVLVGDKLFGCWMGLWCLDASRALKPCWKAEDEAFEDYTSIITDGRRLLIATVSGELLLVEADPEAYKLVSRVRVFDRRTELLAHPAVVGNRLYLRDTGSIVCVRLW